MPIVKIDPLTVHHATTTTGTWAQRTQHPDCRPEGFRTSTGGIRSVEGSTDWAQVTCQRCRKYRPAA